MLKGTSDSTLPGRVDQELIFNASSEEEEEPTLVPKEQPGEDIVKLEFMRQEIIKVEDIIKEEVAQLEQKLSLNQSNFKVFKQLNEYNLKAKRVGVEKLAKANAEKEKEVAIERERLALLKALSAV